MLPRAPPSTFFPYTTLFRSLLGITLFFVVHAFFRLRLLSFAYLIPLQRFLYYGAWLWLPMAWLMPPSWFWAVLSFYLPVYLTALCLSLIAREWVHQLYAPLVPFAYPTRSEERRVGRESDA